MAKRKLPEKYSGSGYSDWGIKRTISEAKNICRWSPWHTHAWMEEARNQISLDAPFYSEFNDAVKYINNYWLGLERFKWYNQTTFWEFDGESRPLTLLEEI